MIVLVLEEGLLKKAEEALELQKVLSLLLVQRRSFGVLARSDVGERSKYSGWCWVLSMMFECMVKIPCPWQAMEMENMLRRM
jgi:hypothetical protein